MPSVKAAAFALLLAGASAAMAQEGKSPLPAHLPLGKEVCYGRVYDRQHLAKHPKQLVTSLHLFRDLSPDQNTESEPQTREEFVKYESEGGYVNVSAYVRFENRKGLYWNALTCHKTPDGKLTRCGIDCDGGSFTLKPQQKNLVLTNEGFVLVGGCGASEDESENPVFFHPGEDDKTFRLEPLPLAQCMALRDALKPAYAKMGKPLRVRFANENAVCYSRTYDDKHLARNPKQTVRRIALLKAVGGKDKHPDAPGYDLTFRVETKDGRKFEKTAKCYPDTYAYTCPADADFDTIKDIYLTRAGDDALNIRDRRGKLGGFFGVKLGDDDRLFRLHASKPADCDF